MIIPENKEFLKFINKITNGSKILADLNLSKMYGKHKLKWKKNSNLYYTYGRCEISQSYLFLFDLDWIIKLNNQKMVHEIQEYLEEIIKKGYTLIFISNHYIKNKCFISLKEKMNLITNFLVDLKLPCMVFIDTGDGKYDKVNTISIWDKIIEIIPHIDYSFYVGTGLDSFPNYNIQYFRPEEIFPSYLFNCIKEKLNDEIDTNFIKSIKTQDGQTQKIERVIIAKFEKIFKKMGLFFEKAPSQQAKDFRNVGGINLNIEVKKTDSNFVCFNDTLPTADTYYVILCTLAKKSNISPQILYLNGNEFIKDSPWINDYMKKINILKDIYGRGEKAQKLPGIMKVYPRPNFRANITKFLN